jgi:hypothetical protein
MPALGLGLGLPFKGIAWGPNPDIVPDAYSFTDVGPVELSTVTTSAPVTMAGLTGATAITVSGGTYSINGGSYVSTPGTVVNGDQIRARHTSSASELTATNTVVTVGGVADTFTSTTGDATPAAFSFVDQADVAPGVVITSAAVVLSGLTISSPISVTGGEYSVDGAAFTSSAGTVVNGASIRARNTSSATHSTAVNTVVTVGGVSDTFTSTSWPTDVAWYKFNTGITQAGGFASQWDDQSGSANHLVAAPAQPTVDGAGVLTFDGVDDFMYAIFALIQPYTVFLRVKQITYTSTDRFFDGSVQTANLRQSGTTPAILMNAGSSVASNTNLAIGAWGSVAVVFNGASSSIKVDQTTETTGNAGAQNPGGFIVATNNTGLSNWANIALKEAVIFPSALSGAQRANINAYLTTYVP